MIGSELLKAWWFWCPRRSFSHNPSSRMAWVRRSARSSGLPARNWSPFTLCCTFSAMPPISATIGGRPCKKLLNNNRRVLPPNRRHHDPIDLLHKSRQLVGSIASIRADATSRATHQLVKSVAERLRLTLEVPPKTQAGIAHAVPDIEATASRRTRRPLNSLSWPKKPNRFRRPPTLSGRAGAQSWGARPFSIFRKSARSRPHRRNAQ